MSKTPQKLSVISDLEAVAGVVPYEPKPPKTKKTKDDLDVIFLRLDRAVVKQFRVLSAELGRSQKELGCEALNLVFARYGKPQIAK